MGKTLLFGVFKIKMQDIFLAISVSSSHSLRVKHFRPEPLSVRSVNFVLNVYQNFTTTFFTHRVDLYFCLGNLLGNFDLGKCCTYLFLTSMLKSGQTENLLNNQRRAFSNA